MSIRERLSGNEATAIAMKQINPDVVAAFPISRIVAMSFCEPRS